MRCCPFQRGGIQASGRAAVSYSLPPGFSSAAAQWFYEMELLVAVVPFFFLVWRPEDWWPTEETVWP